MTATNIIMLVLLAWIVIACWCLCAALYDLARDDLNR